MSESGSTVASLDDYLYEWPQGQRPKVTVEGATYYITSVDKRHPSELIINLHKQDDGVPGDPDLIFSIKDLDRDSLPEGQPLLIRKIPMGAESNLAASHWTFFQGGDTQLFSQYAGQASILIDAINARGLP